MLKHDWFVILLSNQIHSYIFEIIMRKNTINNHIRHGMVKGLDSTTKTAPDLTMWSESSSLSGPAKWSTNSVVIVSRLSWFGRGFSFLLSSFFCNHPIPVRHAPLSTALPRWRRACHSSGTPPHCAEPYQFLAGSRSSDLYALPRTLFYLSGSLWWGDNCSLDSLPF